MKCKGNKETALFCCLSYVLILPLCICRKDYSHIISDEGNKTSVTALQIFLLSEIQSILCLNDNICCKTRGIQNLSDVLNSALKTQFKLKKLQSMWCSAP